MPIIREVRELGGVARVSDLYARGVSRHFLTRAVQSGNLQRVRRNWVALPEADPDLVLAAARGVILSCITQAKRIGLWVPRHPVQHVAAPRGRHVDRNACTVHWATPLLPRVPGVLQDPIENVLQLVAACQPFEDALAIWESAINKDLVHKARLRALPLNSAARKLLDASSPYSDSGLETIFRTRLRWLRVAIRPQLWIEGHRVDFLIGERLVVQIDGGHHVGAQRDEDIRHDAQLMLRGYHVIRVSYHQVMREWPLVQDLIQSAIAQELHLARR